MIKRSLSLFRYDEQAHLLQVYLFILQRSWSATKYQASLVYLFILQRLVATLSLRYVYQLLNTKQLLYRYRSVIPSKLGYKELRYWLVFDEQAHYQPIRYRYLIGYRSCQQLLMPLASYLSEAYQMSKLIFSLYAQDTCLGQASLLAQ